MAVAVTLKQLMMEFIRIGGDVKLIVPAALGLGVGSVAGHAGALADWRTQLDRGPGKLTDTFWLKPFRPKDARVKLAGKGTVGFDCHATT